MGPKLQPLGLTGPTADYTTMALARLAPIHSWLDGVGIVGHPPQIPSAWREATGLRPPSLLPARISHGFGTGWQLIQTPASPLFPQTRHYLLPPEPLLAAVLDATVYSALLSAGIVAHPRATHLPEGFGTQRQSAMEQLHTLLQAYCPIPLGNDQWADTSTIDGSLLIYVDGETFLLHQETFAQTELSTTDLESFARLGLIAIRRATRTMTTSAPHEAFERRPRAGERLDLETFAIEVIERWGTAPIAPVVSETVMASPEFQAYPMLCAWLRKHRAWIESQEVERMRSLLRELEDAKAVSQQQGILNQVAGLMAEITVRPTLVEDYHACLREDPNALLLLSHQIADAAGRLASDAIIGTISTDAGGQPCLLLRTIYEITLTIERSATCSLQLRRARDDRYQDGLYIRKDTGTGCLVPIRLTANTVLGLEPHVLPDDTAATIRAIITDCRTRAITRFKAPEWDITRTVTAHGGRQAPAALRPTISLGALTLDTFDDWARQMGSDTLVCWGDLRPEDSLVGFAVDTAAPDALPHGHFAITMVRDIGGAWHVTDTIGGNLPKVIPFLRRIPDLAVPSDEWLGRNRNGTLSAFTSIDQLSAFTVGHLDRWASREEWNSSQLVVTGKLEPSGRIVRFAAATTVPTTLPKTYCRITCERDNTGTWNIRAVDGHRVAAIIQVLRATKGLQIPSNEWLSSDFRYTFSEVTSITALAQLTTHHFAQWAREWGNPIVTLVGTVVGTKITGFVINPTQRLEAHFQVVLGPLPSGAWEVLSVHGQKLTDVVPVLRTIPGLTVPSNEWLSRTLPYTLSDITSTDAVAALTTEQLEQWEREWNSPRIVLSGGLRDGATIAAFRVEAKIPDDLPDSYFSVVLDHGPYTGWEMERTTGTGGAQLLPVLRHIPNLAIPKDAWLSVGEGSAITRFYPTSDIFQPLGVESLETLEHVTTAQLTEWAKKWKGRTLVISGGRVNREGHIDRLAFHPRLPTTLPDTGFMVTLEQDSDAVWHVRAANGPGTLKILGVLRKNTEILVPSNEQLFRGHRQSFSAFNTLSAFANLNKAQLDRWADEWASQTLVIRSQYSSTRQKIDGFMVASNDTEPLPKGYFSLTVQRAEDGQWCLMEVDGRGLPPILKALRAAGNIVVRSDEWLGRDFTEPLNEITTIDTLGTITPATLDQWAKEWDTDTLFLRGILRKRTIVGSFKVGTTSPSAADEKNYFIIILTRTDGHWRFNVRGLHTGLMRDTFSAAGFREIS